MRLAKNGSRAEHEQDVLRRLYETHHKTVLAYLRRRTDPDTAFDLVTETFLVAWTKISKLPKHEAGWLCAIARNLLANHNRSTQRRVVGEGRLNSVMPNYTSSAEEHVVGSTSAIIEALHQLSSADQEVLMLVAWDGLSGAEAAGALGCTRSTFNVRLHRARKRLEHLLTPDQRRIVMMSQPEEAPNC